MPRHDICTFHYRWSSAWLAEISTLKRVFKCGRLGFSPRFKVGILRKNTHRNSGSGLWVSKVLLESRKACETRGGQSWKGTQTKSIAFPSNLLAVRFSVRVVRNLPKDELRNWSRLNDGYRDAVSIDVWTTCFLMILYNHIYIYYCFLSLTCTVRLFVRK